MCEIRLHLNQESSGRESQSDNPIQINILDEYHFTTNMATVLTAVTEQLSEQFNRKNNGVDDK